MTADGTLTPWLSAKDGITAPGALTLAPDGSLYLIDFRTPNIGTSVGAIKRITPDGKVSLFSDNGTNTGLSFLSQLTFDAQGNLYVTFTATGEVWRYVASGSGVGQALRGSNWPMSAQRPLNRRASPMTRPTMQ